MGVSHNADVHWKSRLQSVAQGREATPQVVAGPAGCCREQLLGHVVRLDPLLVGDEVVVVDLVDLVEEVDVDAAQGGLPLLSRLELSHSLAVVGSPWLPPCVVCV